MTTIQTLHADLIALTERVQAIESRQLRFMQAWIASHLTSSTSGKTEPTSPIATEVIIRHGRRYFPQMAGWVGEKLISWALPYLVPLLLAGWGLIYGFGTKLWQLVTGLRLWFGL